MYLVRLRVWLPDRPGALGAVASRIGGVKGDVIGIEILEQGAGRAVDDLVVALPSASLVDLLVAEVAEVDGVDIEEVVPVDASAIDHDLLALEAAASIVAVSRPERLIEMVLDRSMQLCNATWAIALDDDATVVSGARGPTPSIEWLRVFVQGSQSSDRVLSGEAGPEDILWAPLGGYSLVIGREHRPFRSRERRRLLSFARIADARLRQIGG
ncbi:unannotated protein [freshwater metagenome]|uniref:Unannotated protein n=1 Tax=freshwater metagenome TaxID=449393 RepID=A0A6J6TS28_9ZZZZ|nr:hypothetical protein [Actinomycetota bacterium]MSW92360.1 hypothetical protein [Actinomycetota bacterium]MSY72064.1 hypothetical protein [Actinomycetota bacterium]